MAKGQIRRKNYLILIRFQIRYIVYILLFMYMGAAIAGYTVYWTTWVTIGEKLASVYPRGRLTYIFHTANVTLLLRMALITPLFILVGTLLSHRIAGPVYAIGRFIDRMKSGDYSGGLTLRKKDQLKGLAIKISGLKDKLKSDSEKRVEISGKIIESLRSTNLPSETLSDIEKKLETMKG